MRTNINCSKCLRQNSTRYKDRGTKTVVQRSFRIDHLPPHVFNIHEEGGGLCGMIHNHFPQNGVGEREQTKKATGRFAFNDRRPGLTTQTSVFN